MQQISPESFGMPHRRTIPKATPGRLAVLGVVLAGGLTLLIWTRLRLVANVPRTAYADPRDAPQPGQNPQPAEHAQPPQPQHEPPPDLPAPH